MTQAATEGPAWPLGTQALGNQWPLGEATLVNRSLVTEPCSVAVALVITG